ncbi:MAG: Sugar-specific transcriptional regulator TrmB [Pseudomonadota bacterium]|jgi:DNA-binding MarR family transcriptional regulator
MEAERERAAPAGDGASPAGGPQGRDPADRHAMRLLDVLEAVCRHGPAPLADLVRRTGLPRGAVWRALDVLRDKGWVRMRHGDKAFVLRAPVPALFSGATMIPPEVEAAMPLFERLVEGGPVHVDLGLFVASGEFRIVETTRKDGYGRPPLSLTDDDVAIAAQVHLTPPAALKHLKSFMERATSEERQVIASGEHVRALRRLRESGALWHDDGSAVALAVAHLPGLALRVELWRVSQSRIRDLRDFVAEFRRSSALR